MSLAHLKEGVIMFDRTSYAPLHEMVCVLAQVCNGAETRDLQGFDGADTRVGHLLAFLPLDAWPLAAFHRAWQLMQKYHRQLAIRQLSCLLPEPPLFEGEERQIAFFQGAFLVVFPNHDEASATAFLQISGSFAKRQYISQRVFFLYRIVPSRQAEALLTFAQRFRFKVAPEAEKQAWLLATHRILLEGERIALYFPEQFLNSQIKTVSGYAFSREGDGPHWTIPITSDSVAFLVQFLSQRRFAVSASVTERIAREVK